MKKICLLVASLVIAGGSLFAGDFYNGDVQFQAGLGLNKVIIEDEPKDITSKEFNLGIQSYHLFKPIDLVGVGFMAGFNGGVGKTDNWKSLGNNATNEDSLAVSLNFEIGPAVGLYLGNIVRIGFNIGYNTGWSFNTPENFKISSGNGYTNISTSYNGLSLGLQGKFFPNSRVNPVIGWRLVKGFSDSVEIIKGGNARKSYKMDTYSYKFDLTQNVIYAALALSW